MNIHKFKESNQDWIGEIPFDWDLKKIKELFVERNEKVDDWPENFITKIYFLLERYYLKV